MTEPRRVRTQAERDADGQAWRAVANSRPGYATWPQTAKGDPSWWRAANPSIGHRIKPDAIAQAVAGPPPVDGETCPKWCGFCHLNAGEPEPMPERIHDGGPGPLPPIPDSAYPPDAVDLPYAVMGDFSIFAPRRRWWHRLTRRAL